MRILTHPFALGITVLGSAVLCPAVTWTSTAWAAPSLIDLPVMQALVTVMRAQPIYRPLALERYELTAPEPSQINGWSYAYRRLVAHGLDPKYVESILADERMGKYDPIFFSLSPREPKDIYHKRNNKTEVTRALNFYLNHADEFSRASKEFNVPESVILSILQVETHCGSFTGNKRVLPALLRLASAADSENISANYQQKSAADRTISLDDVQARAEWLEETFFPHAVATIVFANKHNLNPLEVRGSGAGAIGLAQFLPGNVFLHGVDGDQDGTVDPFSVADAIPSVAAYLRNHGWHSLLIPNDQKRQVIADYNRSTPYIDLVLSLASRLEAQIKRVQTQEVDERNRRKNPVSLRS